MHFYTSIYTCTYLATYTHTKNLWPKNTHDMSIPGTRDMYMFRPIYIYSSFDADASCVQTLRANPCTLRKLHTQGHVYAKDAYMQKDEIHVGKERISGHSFVSVRVHSLSLCLSLSCIHTCTRHAIHSALSYLRAAIVESCLREQNSEPTWWMQTPNSRSE